MRGYSNQVSFEVEPMVGEIRVIAGVRCEWHETASGAGYLSDWRDPVQVSAIRVRGGWRVGIESAGVRGSTVVSDLDAASVADVCACAGES